MRTSRSPTTVITANGEVQTREDATVYVKELDLFVTVMLLEETPAVFSLGSSARTIHTTGPAVKNHTSSEMARELIEIYPTLHLWFLVHQRVLFSTTPSSTSSSTMPKPTSPSSSSQDSVIDVNRCTENPVPERSGSASEELRRDPLHESTESKSKNKHGNREEVQRNFSHELLDWLQEFRENLVDEGVLAESR